MSNPVDAALFALRQKEERKVELLSEFLESDELIKLSPKLNTARENLQTNPEQIYYLLGSLISSDEDLHSFHRIWHSKLSYLSDADLTKYLSEEMLIKRTTDNATAQLIFKILYKAKNLADLA